MHRIFFSVFAFLLPLSASFPLLSPGFTDCRDQKQGRSFGLDPNQVGSLPEKSRRYALVVGVDKYEDSKITPLQGSTNDARTLAQALERFAGFPKDQIILLTTDQPPERQPKRNVILEALSNLAAAAKKEQGMLLISFAGHGIERQGRTFLLSSDARLGNENDLDLLEDTAVGVSRMKDRIRGLDQVVLILDACRNDPSAGRSAAPNPLTDTFRRGFDFDVKNKEVRAFATLYATSPGEISYEYREKKQGYFTWALVEALTGNVPEVVNSKGEITLGSLVKYLQERVPKLVSVSGGRKQTPSLVVEGYKPDQLVIAVTVNVNIVGQPSPTPTSDADFELEFWRSIQNSTNPAEFREYLKAYPNGKFAGLAKTKIAGLEGVKSAATNIAESSLQTFDFISPMLDDTGRIARKRTLNGRRYVQDLGGGIGLELVEVPAGSFLMGSDDQTVQRARADKERFGASADVAKVVSSWETPRHEVNIPPFFIGKFEVTQAQWAVVSALPKINRDLPANPSYTKGPNFPVDHVSWDDAVEFCARLTRLTGRFFRLPSEAEWEYACRAGSTTIFAFGNTLTTDLANYHGQSPFGTSPKGEYRAKMVSVGSLGAPNAFGIHDMHGNVWEWCADEWHQSYEGAPTDGKAWGELGAGRYRVLRGGGWFSGGDTCRSAFRTCARGPEAKDALYAAPSGSNFNSVGLRVVMSPTGR